jgi:hypothetical protein
LTTEQIGAQLSLTVDRVTIKGSLHDREMAALAIRQARGDLIEAIFLIRASRTTLPRFGYPTPIETSEMLVRRRSSSSGATLRSSAGALGRWPGGIGTTRPCGAPWPISARCRSRHFSSFMRKKDPFSPQPPSKIRWETYLCFKRLLFRRQDNCGKVELTSTSGNDRYPYFNHIPR